MHRLLKPPAPPKTRAGFLALIALALAGCGQSDRAPAADMMPAGSDDNAPPADGIALPVVEAPPLSLAASDDTVHGPMDATPAPDSDRVFYLALKDDVAGVFSVEKPGAEIETLVLGEPLIAPVGISISADGDQVFVADSGYVTAEGAGAIAMLSSAGGEVVVLEGTEGYVPRGLVVAEVDGEEHVYFTGISPASGEHGLFRVALAGGGVETLASGAPFVDPAGVSVTGDGDAYVIDAFAGEGSAGVVRVRDGEAARIVRDIGVGFPAGIASTQDGSTVLISGLDPNTRRDRVFILDAESLELSMIVEPFDAFTGGAGLHRAPGENRFAWADTAKDEKGAVYTLEL